jgi:predicted transcriptional regulator
MSPRAAWRLEALGFSDVFDFVAGKTDWFACGHPREGASADTPWAGDLVVEAVTCRTGKRLAEAAELVSASEHDFCVVVNEEGIVAGVLRGDALAKDPEAHVEDVLELGPRTIRPSKPVEELLRKRSSQGVKSWIVTTAHGELLGVLRRADAERALARAPSASASP